MTEPWLRVIAQMKGDATGGASSTGRALATACVDLAEQADLRSVLDLTSSLQDLLSQALEAQPTMATVKFVANEMALQLEDSTTGKADLAAIRSAVRERGKQLVNESEIAVSRIATIGARALPTSGRLMTLSFSQTVLECLKVARAMGKRNDLVVLESRPGGEGIHTVREAVNLGIEVTLIPDAALSAHLPLVNAIIVGADAILANGDLVNKMGTTTAAACARNYGIPVWSLVESWKFDVLSPQGVLPTLAPGPEKNPFGADLPSGIAIDNRMFEIVPADWVTVVVTEFGLGTPEWISSWGRSLRLSQFMRRFL